MIKSGISQKQTQELKLSPQQIQFMKLVQLPVVALAQRVEQEMTENPLLLDRPEPRDTDSDPLEERGSEAEEDPFGEDYLSEYTGDDAPAYRHGSQGAPEEGPNMQQEAATSFLEYLQQQVRMLEFDRPEDKLIAEHIIGNIDSKGYLRRDPGAIALDLEIDHNIQVDREQVEQVLQRIQGLDPPGIAARDTRECLLLQLESRLQQDENGREDCLRLALAIIRDHFEAFSGRKFEKIQDRLQIDEDQLREVIECIQHLNPEPASGFDTDSFLHSNEVIPDFIISNENGELQLRLTSGNTPQLHISDHYREMVKKYKKARQQGKSLNARDKNTLAYLKEKMDAAEWFVQAVQQRKDTLYRCMEAIMHYQQDYFLTGDDKKIKPMILKDIADITNLDISTVSRVVNSKWVQTQFGTILLKELFSEGIQTVERGEVSTLEVKKVLSDIVDQENKREPLTDEEIRAALKEKGYPIARRTVTKYREQLDIPVARLRKTL